MSGLENLNKRLHFHGGFTEGRLEEDKLRALREALYNSYQAETIILEDAREFKCLINPDKLHMDYDNKILSIPFRDRCLNAEKSSQEKDRKGWEEIGLKPGDTFTWKETDTHWIIYLKYLEESAYLRADIRKCDQQVQINDKKYWVYLRGPVETSIPWNQKAGVEWNDMNYSLVMFITRDENTQDFFHRFTKIKILEPGTTTPKTWKVVGQNKYYGDGIVQVFLDEDFENSIEDAVNKDKEEPVIPPIEPNTPHIEGPNKVKKYDTVTYTAVNFTEPGRWYLTQNGQEFRMTNTAPTFTLDVTNSKGGFAVKYKTINQEASMDVKIEAF